MKSTGIDYTLFCSERLQLPEEARIDYRLTYPPSTVFAMPIHGTGLAFHKPWSCNIFFQMDDMTV